MPWTDGATNRRLAALVVDQYGAVCWLCREPINLDLPRTHPFGLSLDHVQPRSQGGTDAVSNLRPAHLRCNLRRGARRPGTVRPATTHPALAGLPPVSSPPTPPPSPAPPEILTRTDQKNPQETPK
jgi:5-methylcytosine-specific restriction endonuclease McrA